MLSLTQAYPDLPGMHLVDPNPDNLRGQIIYLDFDGAKGVEYNGPVSVKNIDVPAFREPNGFAGEEHAIITGIVDSLGGIFTDTGMRFTTSRPTDADTYSIVYVGGIGTDFAPFGNFHGLAESVDVGNHFHADEAFVFSQSLVLPGMRTEEYCGVLGTIIAHEIGHLVGYAHDNASNGSSDLASVAANGTATCEWVTVPSQVVGGQSTHVTVRAKLDGNTKISPWQVLRIGLYDYDGLGIYQTIKEISNPFQITQQGTWYYYTFDNVDLSAYDDGGNGVELYGWVGIDDKTWNGQDAEDYTPLQQVTVLPDLDVVAVELDEVSSLWYVGDDIDARVTVQNVGTATANGCKVEYFLGTATNKQYKPLAYGSLASINGMQPGEVESDWIGSELPGGGWTITSDVTPGTYYIWAHVTTTSGDLNSANDWEKSSAFAIKVRVPDLDVVSVELDEASSLWYVGDDIDAKVTVQNVGTAAADDCNVYYFLGTATNKELYPIGDGWLGGIWPLNDMSPTEISEDWIGSSISGGGWTIPATVTPGTYFIWAHATTTSGDPNSGVHVRSKLDV